MSSESKRGRNQHTIDKAPWREEETLRRLFVEQDLSARDIAERLDCSYHTVYRWLDEFDIEVGKPSAEKPPTHWITPKGYEECRSAHNGDVALVRIHRLIAVAEWGFDAVVDKHVHHKNKIPWDNRPENLEVLSPSEHLKHHWETDDRGYELKKSEVREIKQLIGMGFGHREIADKYSVSISTIRDIEKGRTWSNIDA